MPRKPRVTKEQMTLICDELADGKSLQRILAEHDDLPAYRTITRHLQDDEEAYRLYRRARTSQAEKIRDEIIDLVQRPLPDDPKLAMAEVQRRRLEADHLDKYVRQLAPLGIRDKSEDKPSDKVSGTITLAWATTEDKDKVKG